MSWIRPSRRAGCSRSLRLLPSRLKARALSAVVVAAVATRKMPPFARRFSTASMAKRFPCPRHPRHRGRAISPRFDPATEQTSRRRLPTNHAHIPGSDHRRRVPRDHRLSQIAQRPKAMMSTATLQAAPQPATHPQQPFPERPPHYRLLAPHNRSQTYRNPLHGLDHLLSSSAAPRRP